MSENAQGVWVVSGTSRGIGLAMVRALLERGTPVLAIYRDKPGNALSEIAEQDERLSLLRWDLVHPADPTAIEQVVQAPVEVLFCNAGVFGPQPGNLQDKEFDGMRHAFDVNALGTLRMIEAFLPWMKEADWPRIAAVTSLLGTMPRSGPGALGYRMSKAALNVAMVSLAHELKPLGVTTVCLRPGWVKTQMGGPNGKMSPMDSARVMLSVMDNLDRQAGPQLLDTDGSVLPW
ncbi:MAG: SDR family NAD(P)-dependent oxidoreductase [Pseudomonadota bacterium]